MMKKLFFILTFCFFLIPPVFAFDCSQIPVNPVIKITSSYGKLNIDTGKSSAEITELAQTFNLVENGLFARGLSTVNISFDITINSQGNLVGNSEFCLTPTEVNIFLGLENPTIYLSSDLTPDSCDYNLVLYHEKIHQQINKKTLDYYLPMFKQITEQIIKKIEAVHLTDIKQIEPATADLTKLYNKKLTPLVDYIKREMLTEQQKLDNPENYKFESTVCP